MTPQAKAFLDVLAWSEGTASGPSSGYGVIVSSVSGPASFSDFSAHPFQHGRPAQLVRRATPAEKELLSTASGRYQINLPDWRVLQPRLHLPDFGPASQDAAAIELLAECKALPFLLAGNIEQAIAHASRTWASLPGSSAGQPTHSLCTVLARWNVLYRSPALQEAA